MGQEVERAVKSIEGLYKAGDLSPSSKDALLVIPRVAELITLGLGETSSADELLLAAILVDDSTSIGPLISHVRFGHRLMLEALKPQSASTEVQVMTRALNHGKISPFQALDHATALTPSNFGGDVQLSVTPLYLQSLLTLGIVMIKAQELEQQGAKVRTYTLIITDGEDRDSRGISAAHVRVVVSDMLDFATNHIVAGMGIGEHHDFGRTFRAMGIRSIYTAGATPQDLEKEFQKISADLQLAASSEAAFYQLSAGSPPR